LLVAQTVCIAAESEGLGNMLPRHLQPIWLIKIIDVLKSSEGVGSCYNCLLSVGPAQTTGNRQTRLPLEAIIHRETYKDYTDKDIELYYKDKEERKRLTGFYKRE